MNIQIDQTSKSSKRLYKSALIVESCILVLVLCFLGISISKNHSKSTKTDAKESLANSKNTSNSEITISQAQIDSWPYYIDKKDGYMIRHPSYIDYSDNSYYFIGDNLRLDSPNGIGPQIEIYIRQGQGLPTGSNALIQQKSVTINNTTGFEDYMNGKVSNYFLIPQSGSKKLAEIRIGTDTSSKYDSSLASQRAHKMYAIALAMMTTFKFIDSTIPTTNTFVNKKFNYSLKYPILWGYYHSTKWADPKVIDILVLGDPRPVGALYVQDNLNSIENEVYNNIQILIRKSTAEDKKTLTNNNVCGVTGKPYPMKNATAVIFENTGCGLAGGVTFIEILHNNYFYEVQTEMLKNQFDPILKTFTFTN